MSDLCNIIVSATPNELPRRRPFTSEVMIPYYKHIIIIKGFNELIIVPSVAITQIIINII